MILEQARMADEMRRKSSVGPDANAGFTPPKGSLIIADNFTPTNPGDKFSHGEVVNMAARQNGFKGPVFSMSQPLDIRASNAQSGAEMVLTDPQAEKGDILRAVSVRSAAQAISNVQSQTKVVNNAIASGAQNSALNISMGTSKAGIVTDLYSQASLAWNPKAPEDAQAYGKTVAGNFSKAYDLDMDKLQNPDLKVSGPERQKLQQKLVGHVHQALGKNPNMDKAKREWTTAVRRFESQNNSVVISAGNEGGTAKTLARDTGGLLPKVPKDFETNVLEIPEVTSVGATRWSNGAGGPKERRADYSNHSQGTDIYASGSVDFDGDQKAESFGTSFSGPRVAATMAKLHKDNPKMSSDQVENLMKTRLTHDLNSGSKSKLKVLDYHKSSDYLVGRKNP